MLKYLSHKLRTQANNDGNNVQKKVRNPILFIYQLIAL